MGALPGCLLIVDDEPDNFDVIEILLFKEGYHLNYVTNGKDALKLVETSPPDAILLDVMMPELSGIEVCRQIKANPLRQHIPIIMLTALTSKEDLARCFEAGADDFISKPVSGVELRARLRSLLRIKRQYEALQAALQLRTDMSYMIVHDLQNLLTQIAMACMLLEGTPLSEPQQAKVNQIAIAQQRLDSFTNSLLLMAKLEAGKMLLNPQWVDLSELAATAITDFQAIAHQKQVTLVAHLPESGKLLYLDSTLLRRVLDNLLSNALKFSPSNQQIELEITYPDNSHFRVQVTDYGPGVSTTIRDHIFEKYEVGHQVAGVTQIGLGLAFCKMAVEAHGGTIWVKENSPTGAIFIIEILAEQQPADCLLD